MATLTTQETKIDAFDDRRSVFSSRMGTQLEIMAGPHVVAVSVFVSEGAADLPTFRQSPVRVICFEALPGHGYVARPAPDGTLTQPELFDETMNVVVGHACPATGAPAASP